MAQLMAPWILPAISGAFLGALLASMLCLLFQNRHKALLHEELIRTKTRLEEGDQKLAEANTRHADEINRLREEITQREKAEEDLDSRLIQLREDLVQARTRLEEERRTAEEITRHQAEQVERMNREFEALSARALRRNNESFLGLAKELFEQKREQSRAEMEEGRKAVGRLVEPLTQGLEKMSTEIGRIEKARAEAYGGLIEQLRALAGDQQQLRTETNRLSQALRNPSARGQWGEIQLRRVVEMAGMIDRVDFVEQQSNEGSQGRQRPDLIVHLPGGSEVIVDAKTPMRAYLDALDTEDESQRLVLLDQHADHLRQRIRELSRRAYQEQFQSSPEFTVLFLPSESLFYAALERDPGLIEAGVDQKILIATPTTLIALLRAVHYGWQQEAMAENAQRISELGRTLYERLCTLGGKIEKLGNRLNQTIQGYNDMIGSLERRVLPTARSFPELGVGGSKTIPEISSLDSTVRTLQAPDLDLET